MASLRLTVLSPFRPDPAVWSPEEIVAASVGIPTALVTAFLVYRFVRRVPWPRPFRLWFVLFHLVAVPVIVAVSLAVSATVQSLILGASVFSDIAARMPEAMLIGYVLYAIVAGVSYAQDASARAGRAEAIAARTQLAALRAQLHPHFLFNALHTVVQLIPIDPGRAAEAAELVADLLRTTIEEHRDEVALDDEWRFVSRYLAIERIRFGDRLVVRADMPAEVLEESVPSFALQTLVENAVRHGAAHRVAATEIVVAAAGGASELTLSVRNTGDVSHLPTVHSGVGTGLARLRERLAVLYGSAARLVCRPLEDGGFEAVLVLPRHRGSIA